MRLLINALSVSSGGNRTVARELGRHIALLRPTWQVILLLTEGKALHEAFRSDGLPSNISLLYAPAETAHRFSRRQWERRQLPRRCRQIGIDVVIQINGMVVPELPVPTLAHFGDPWPYLPEAWEPWFDPLLAFARRRAHRRSLKTAAGISFTSDWLRHLICERHGFSPRGDVFYNGVPHAWLEQSVATTPQARQSEIIVTIGNVSPYKGQERVIRALPGVLERTGRHELAYHIAGWCDAPYRRRLEQLVAELRLERHVVVEGRVGDERVVELLTQARASVLMSVCESFGIPVVEAMSMGCPVLGANAAALPEVCGGAAELIAPHDPGALVEALSRVVVDDTHATNLAARGLQNVQRFDWLQTAEAMAYRLSMLTCQGVG